MEEPALVSFLLLGLLLILGLWGILIQKASKFQMLNDPVWPFAENPGLALELAGSINDVDAVLGGARTKVGRGNRKAGVRFQKLDFVFIPLYVLFLAAAAWPLGGWRRVWIVAVPALLTGITDVFEDLFILRMLRGKERPAAKWFGLVKWGLFFATLATEGGLILVGGTVPGVRGVVVTVLAAAVTAVGAGGILSVFTGKFAAIKAAATLSALALLALALASFVAFYPLSWPVTAEYAVLLRVPLSLGVLLFALPGIAFLSGAKNFLRGLFDVTPLSLFVVTLASFAVAGTACMTASIILKNAWARFDVGHGPVPLPGRCVWLIIMAALSFPAVITSLVFSARQKRKPGGLIIAALVGSGLAVAAASALIESGADWVASILPFLLNTRLENALKDSGLFAGYVQTRETYDPRMFHLRAVAAFVATAILYVGVGIYGWRQLGKKRTVPALGSLLMLVLMLGWLLSAAAFFFDKWHIPTLLVVAAVALLTAQSSRSDHFYHLRDLKIGPNAPQPDAPMPEAPMPEAPRPPATITATGGNRVIVAAANGGGIQAAAWAARVLYGLGEADPDKFAKSLRMVSSVSGGSVGGAFFVHWLANQHLASEGNDPRVPPHKAAAESSLDEVAWGLAWPDFMRALFPWLLDGRIGRGRALERAWLLSTKGKLPAGESLDQRLGDWNGKVTAGEIPAVVLNATVAETGERLLFATTRLDRSSAGRARVDATELHTINGKRHDVGVVTAARLSATFPYVTPAARADGLGPQPHVVDGGYYDNYGMATLVEWLDEALAGAGNRVESVLVIQIHGMPINPDPREQRHAKARGWFYQAFAPLETLAAVRNAGQIAHNDVELEMLQQKWAAAGIPIHSVTFEFGHPDPPHSWHLTQTEVDAIEDAWNKDMSGCKEVVEQFLDGREDLHCGCVACESRQRP